MKYQGLVCRLDPSLLKPGATKDDTMAELLKNTRDAGSPVIYMRPEYS